nr:hypothetical protein [Tanacetum cinerariifolium]
SSKLKRLKKVGTSQRIESSDDMENVFNKGRMVADMDMNEGIELVKDAEVAEFEGRNVADHTKKQAKMYIIDLDHSSKVLSMQEDDTEVVAASTPIPAAKPKILNIVAAPTGMKYDEILIIFQAKFDANMRFLFKLREKMEEEDAKIIKSINETPVQKAAKKRKLHEQAKEDEDLKKQLEGTMFEKTDGQDARWRNQ